MSCPNHLKDEITHCLKHSVSEAWNQLRSKRLSHWLIVVLLIGVGTFIGHKIGQGDLWIDWRYKLYQAFLHRLTPRPPHPKRTVIVLIGDQEYWHAPLDGRRPLKRDYLARLLRKLDEANPEVIALDVDLSLPTSDSPCDKSLPYHDENEKLFEAVTEISERRTLVLGRRLRYADPGEKEFEPVPALFDCPNYNSGRVRSGYITLPPDLRQLPLALTMKDRTTKVDSFASAILGAVDQRSLSDAQEKEQDALPYGTFIKPEQFLSRSADYVFKSDLKTLKDDIAFKVVIVGGAWHRFGVNQGPQNDSHQTPVGDVYGAYVHANYVEALIDSRTYKPMRQMPAISIEIFFSIILALALSLNIRLSIKVGLALLLCVLVMGISYVTWQNLGMFFDFFAPVLLLVGHVVVEKLLA